MIKNIVFDIGNVLVNFAWKEYFKNLGLEGEKLERVINATVKSPDWDEVDKGEVDNDGLMNLFIENDPGIEEELRMVFDDIHDMLIQFEYAKGWILDLQRKGFKVYCLSNMSHKAVADCADALNFLPMLDGYILSCNINICKPDPGIYKALFDKYSLDPAECIFIDDLSRNIEAGKALGMKGIVFTGVKTAQAEIDRIVAAESGNFKSSYKKSHRIAALVCVCLIGILVISNLILAFINTDFARRMLRVTLGLTLGLPILTWVYIWMIGKLTGRKTIADFHFFEGKDDK